MAAIEITWVHVYKPKMVMGSTEFDLPVPLKQRNETYTKTVKLIKVPLNDGIIAVGISRGPLTLSFAGEISQTSKEAVLYQKEKLLEYFIETNQQFTLYTYYDATNGNYRWYENCIVTNLSFGANQHNPASGVLNYAFSVTVPDGKEHVTSVAGTGTPSLNLEYGSGATPANEGEASSETLPASTAYLHGPIHVKLASGGVFLIEDSNGNYIFRVDEDGSVQTTGFVETVDSISYP